MVVGSRFADGSSTMTVSGIRRVTMRVLASSASRATHSIITDSTSGFRLIRQPLLGRFSRLFASNYLGDTYEALSAAGRAGFMQLVGKNGLTEPLKSPYFASVQQLFSLYGVSPDRICGLIPNSYSGSTRLKL